MIENPTLRKAVEFAILTEQNGARFYARLAEKYAGNTELKELFLLLGKDEAHHEEQFKALLDSLPEDEQRGFSEQDAEYLQALSSAEMFYGHNDALDTVDKLQTTDDALERAHRLERASILYYTAIREVLGASPALDAIIRAEKQHLTQVMRYAVTGAKVRGLSDAH